MTTNSRPLSHGEFLAAARFDALDGVRAIAVAMVITVHTGAYPSRWLALMDGTLGVTVFFVVSGFLITTLLLREEAACGAVSLRAFYVRRCMRLLPAYYLVLGIYVGYTLLAGSADAAERRAGLIARLPHFLLYMNEYAAFVEPASTIFGHSWSLAIEEKFYIVWPALAFAALRKRPRLREPVVLALAIFGTAVASLFPHVPTFGDSYAALLVGCLLALAMHQEKWFSALSFASSRWAHYAIVAAAVCLQVIPSLHDLRRTVVYPATVALVLYTLMAHVSPITRMLGGSFMRFVGQRSYAVYLVHVLAMHVGQRAVGPLLGSGEAAALVACGVTTCLSLVAADVIYRVVEQPLILRGRAMSEKILSARPE